MFAYELSNVMLPKLCHTTHFGHQKAKTPHVVSSSHSPLELAQTLLRIH